MDVEAYRIFLSIVRNKSFSKTAELFYVSPPAISHTVSSLEKSFGFSLFKRNKKGIELTTLGEEVLPYITQIVKKEDEMLQLVSEFEGLSKGHVRIGIFNSMCVYLPNVLEEFKLIYPNITFEIYQGSYEDVISWLKDEVIDIGFLSKSINKEFAFYEIFRDPLMCILPADTKTTDDSEIDLNEILKFPFIMQRESCDADAKRIMNKLGLDVHTACHVVDDLTTVSMVRAGYGVAIMPLLTMNGLASGVKMLRIKPYESRIIGVVTKDEFNLAPAVKKAYEFIKGFKYN